MQTDGALQSGLCPAGCRAPPRGRIYRAIRRQFATTLENARNGAKLSAPTSNDAGRPSGAAECQWIWVEPLAGAQPLVFPAQSFVVDAETLDVAAQDFGRFRTTARDCDVVRDEHQQMTLIFIGHMRRTEIEG